MLQKEIEHHEEGSNNNLATCLKIWMGDVETALREAIKRKQLNEWLVIACCLIMSQQKPHESWLAAPILRH